MATNLSSIIGVIEAWKPTYDSDVAIDCRKPSELKNRELDNGPVRMIFLPEDSVQEWIGLGTRVYRWQILDRLFIKQVPLGEGVEWANEQMQAYIINYATYTEAGHGIYTGSVIEGVTFNPRYDISYPEGSDTNWFGVDCLITIREHRA